MELEFPRIVYRAGGPWQLESGAYSVKQVNSAKELAQAEGWHLDQYAAKAAEQPADATVVEPPADSAPPTRAELEQKATELGLKFDGRTTDRKLSALIAEKLGA
jgi:hypothetical protein